MASGREGTRNLDCTASRFILLPASKTNAESNRMKHLSDQTRADERGSASRVCAQTMSLMSRTWLVRCLSTNILDAPATVFLHVYEQANQNQAVHDATRAKKKKKRNETSEETAHPLQRGQEEADARGVIGARAACPGLPRGGGRQEQAGGPADAPPPLGRRQRRGRDARGRRRVRFPRGEPRRHAAGRAFEAAARRGGGGAGRVRVRELAEELVRGRPAHVLHRHLLRLLLLRRRRRHRRLSMEGDRQTGGWR